MLPLKKVAAIHDISGFGKCSLTVALPLLSACGIETSVMPTAVLSSHTGGFTGFTYRDLTDDLRPFAAHWKTLGLAFDALYSGYLGSFSQLEIVSEFFDEFRTRDTLILVDPVMGDGGKLYSKFTPDFAAGMAKLCSQADIIVPNLTEAAFLLGEDYIEGPYEKVYIEALLTKLSALGPKKIVLTGVWFDGNMLGAASFDANSGEIQYAFSPKVQGQFHGTGDIFGSVLLSSLLTGFSLAQGSEISVDFVYRCIKRTAQAGTDVRFGVHFEQEIPSLLKQLNLL